MKHYSSVALLDTTYKTVKYALPLFSTLIKINVSYISVGLFVILYKTSKDITKALNMFKTWNPKWKPDYFLVDYCEAEINVNSYYLVYIFNSTESKPASDGLLKKIM